MYCLEVIHKLSARHAPRSSADTRESSAVRSRGGVVVHSARLRSTAFVSAPGFWRKWEAADSATRHKMADRACLKA
jgi:hypothetical protein